jgi:hypothetical protein
MTHANLPKTIYDLPPELLSLTCSFLPLKAFKRFEMTCKDFYRFEAYSGINSSVLQLDFDWLLKHHNPLLTDPILVNIFRKNKRIILDHSINTSYGQFSLLRAAVKIYGSVGLELNKYFPNALMRPNIEDCQFLIDNDADVNYFDGYFTPLLYAIRTGNLNIVKFLVDKGARLDAADIVSKTVISHAIIRGDLDILTYLIKRRGNNIHKLNSKGETWLHEAAKAATSKNATKSSFSVYLYLLDLGLDSTTRSLKGTTALDDLIDGVYFSQQLRGLANSAKRKALLDGDIAYILNQSQCSYLKQFQDLSSAEKLLLEREIVQHLHSMF